MLNLFENVNSVNYFEQNLILGYVFVFFLDSSDKCVA